MEIIKKDEYIFSDVYPINPDINIEELKIIERKLKEYTEGYTNIGLTAEEAEKFLDWITLNARKYAVRNIPEAIESASMAGQCAPTQRINCTLLKRLGLDVRPFNTADCIGDIPLSEEDERRIKNGWLSPAVRHSVALVKLPVINEDGSTSLKSILLDPTFRQFCIKENCQESRYYNSMSKGIVAPHPGYFMQKENLIKMGIDEKTANDSEKLAKFIIQRGYFVLNDRTAKIYGDAFARASTRIEFKNSPIIMKGKGYINNFENKPMKQMGGSKGDEKYTKLPSEIISKKSLISRIKDFFKKKKMPILPEGNRKENSLITNNNDLRERIEYTIDLNPQVNGKDTSQKNRERY